ncbi:fructose 1,6-bisphosphatase [Pseudofulvibacter geojedonensis]|uniref:Fructose 1,6-bisphosphatase n=1 Tax=Pseudofulvibacter geojedonensis TaxID=1123758 RepID=A0ABW3I1B9_9FLAO
MGNKTKLTPPVENDNTSKIEAIKNLIFGENIAEYNSEFEEIKADINKKKAILEELIETTRTELNQAIDNLGTDLNIRITELEDTIENKIENLDEKKVDRKQLGDLLIKLGNKISE